MLAYIRVVQNGLAATPESEGALDGFRLGEVVKVDVRQVRGRSGAFHRKYFALLKCLHGYLDFPCSADSFRAWAQVRAGHFEVLPDGAKVPRSIKFSKMSEAEFSELYSRVIDWALADLLPGTVSAEDLEEQVEQLLTGFG